MDNLALQRIFSAPLLPTNQLPYDIRPIFRHFPVFICFIVFRVFFSAPFFIIDCDSATLRTLGFRSISIII
jgi:hypothetical protein